MFVLILTYDLFVYDPVILMALFDRFLAMLLFSCPKPLKWIAALASIPLMYSAWSKRIGSEDASLSAGLFSAL